jgi:hypothetical protein
MIERVLSLDISSKTGWALLVSSPSDIELEAYGQVPQIPQPDGSYPGNFVDWAYKCFGEIVKLIDRLTPDVLVIEETAAGSKSIHSQKILEFIHFLVAKFIKDTGIRAIYLMTEQWRRETGCLMSKEEKKRNKQVKEYKDKHSTKIAYSTDGKRIGKITRKHVNIRRANEVFGEFLPKLLKKKDEDTADALLLAYCYHARKLRSNV